MLVVWKYLHNERVFDRKQKCKIENFFKTTKQKAYNKSPSDDNLRRLWSWLSGARRWIRDRSGCCDGAQVSGCRGRSWWWRCHHQSLSGWVPSSVATRGLERYPWTTRLGRAGSSPRPCRRCSSQVRRWMVVTDPEFSRLGVELKYQSVLQVTVLIQRHKRKV